MGLSAFCMDRPGNQHIYQRALTELILARLRIVIPVHVRACGPDLPDPLGFAGKMRQAARQKLSGSHA